MKCNMGSGIIVWLIKVHTFATKILKLNISKNQLISHFYKYIRLIKHNKIKKQTEKKIKKGILMQRKFIYTKQVYSIIKCYLSNFFFSQKEQFVANKSVIIYVFCYLLQVQIIKHLNKTVFTVFCRLSDSCGVLRVLNLEQLPDIMH